MIPRLPYWILTEKKPAFYETESRTAVEMVAKVYAKIQEIIDDYNKFVDTINTHISDYELGINQDFECFKENITKIMHDYIITLDTKIAHQDRKIDESIVYIKENLSQAITDTIANLTESGELESAIINAFDNLGGRVLTLENNFTSLESRTSELENSQSALSERTTTLETNQTNLSNITTNLEERTTTLEAKNTREKADVTYTTNFGVSSWRPNIVEKIGDLVNLKVTIVSPESNTINSSPIVVATIPTEFAPVEAIAGNYYDPTSGAEIQYHIMPSGEIFAVFLKAGRVTIEIKTSYYTVNRKTALVTYTEGFIVSSWRPNIVEKIGKLVNLKSTIVSPTTNTINSSPIVVASIPLEFAPIEEITGNYYDPSSSAEIQYHIMPNGEISAVFLKAGRVTLEIKVSYFTNN